jgi:hypothetical protein
VHTPRAKAPFAANLKIAKAEALAYLEAKALSKVEPLAYLEAKALPRLKPWPSFKAPCHGEKPGLKPL